MTKVSVIIPTKNEEKNIGRCLQSLQSQNYTSIEVIVVDNHSNDKTRQITQKFGAEFFEKGPERSVQRNFGAQKATGEILFFIDADMEIGKEVIKQAVDLIRADPEIKSILVPEKSVGNHFWARVRALERNCYLGESTIEAARIFDRNTFLKIGGFDESLIAAEDWDLTQRASRIGKISRVKDEIIHHEGHLSLLDHLKKKYYYAKDIKRYAIKHPEQFKTQAGIARLKPFAKNWKKLVADPIHGMGVLILKSLEYLSFILAGIK